MLSVSYRRAVCHYLPTCLYTHYAGERRVPRFIAATPRERAASASRADTYAESERDWHVSNVRTYVWLCVLNGELIWGGRWVRGRRHKGLRSYSRVPRYSFVCVIGIARIAGMMRAHWKYGGVIRGIRMDLWQRAWEWDKRLSIYAYMRCMMLNREWGSLDRYW